MDIIIKWVTQIIIFLLLATIIDLLIPATSMKKYIKLVVGLILMLILLKPIFFMFSIDFQSELESAFTELYEEGNDVETIEYLTKMQKVDIQASQDAYILKEMAFQLKTLAKEPLLENHHAEILDIQFLFSTEQTPSLEELEEMIVYLSESDQEEGVVSTINEVIIGPDRSVESVEHDDNEQIKKMLQEIWELHDIELTIHWEGGTS